MPDRAQGSPPVVLIGIGQIGGVFAKALLRAGHTVVPVTRQASMASVAGLHPDPEMALVTVAEDDLDGVLETLPEPWRTRTVLIQNELLPRDWERHDIVDPTVGVLWFEKKRGIDTKVILSSPFAGPHAQMLAAALTEDNIDAHVVGSIVDELVAKNLYILVANIAGLETGGTVSDLWSDHEHLARSVGAEVLEIQEHLLARPIDADDAYRRMLTAFAGDPSHQTTGRSAPRRLARAIEQARRAGIDTPVLDRIARAHGASV